MKTLVFPAILTSLLASIPALAMGPEGIDPACPLALQRTAEPEVEPFDAEFARTDVARLLPWLPAAPTQAVLTTAPMIAPRMPGVKGWVVTIDRKGLIGMTIEVKSAEDARSVADAIERWAKGTVQADSFEVSSERIVIQGVFDPDVKVRASKLDGSSERGGRAEFLRRADQALTNMRYKKDLPADLSGLAGADPSPFRAAGEDAAARAASPLMQALALDLKPRQNFSFNPTSFYEAWMLAAAGSSGKTQREMLALLGADARLPEMVLGASAVHRRINGIAGFNSANAILLNSNSASSLKSGYQQPMEALLGAKVTLANFRDPKTLEELHGWIGRETGGKISKLFDRLDDDIALIVANATSFEVKWARKFNKSKTAPGKFQVARGQTVQAPIMNQVGEFRVMRDRSNALTGVRLDTTVDHVSVDLFLPEHALFGDELAALTDTRRIRGWMAQLGTQERPIEINLSLPKVEINYTIENLIPYLQKMGVKTPFLPGADFSQLTEGPLYFAQFIQKTTLRLDEEGAGGGAATAGAATRGPGPEQVTFDHPFIVAVRVWDEIQYVGIVNDPTAK